MSAAATGQAVTAAEWRGALTAMRDAGLTYFGHLTAVDRGDELEVVAHVSTPDVRAQRLVSTTVPAHRPMLDSIVAVYPGADWHEREAAEMLGIEFAGHPDPRPLLLRSTVGAPPLLKSTVLAARAVTDWPGATDPQGSGSAGTRRRQRPPGVPDSWIKP